MIDEDSIPPRPITYGDLGVPLAMRAAQQMLNGNQELLSRLRLHEPPRRTWLRRKVRTFRWWLVEQLERLAEWIEP